MSLQLNDHDAGEFRSRFKIVIALVTALLCFLILRLWHLQVIRGDELKQRSENNSVRLRKIKSLRGLILDRHGRVLVDNRPSFDIIFLPGRTREVREVYHRLKGLYEARSIPCALEVPEEEKKRGFHPIKLERNIDMKKLAVVEAHALDLPGVSVDVTPVRIYLQGEAMAHIIGYTGEVSRNELKRDTFGELNVGDIIGKDGLEKFLDSYLRGKSGSEQVEVNVLGKEIRVVGKTEPVPGYNVILTIDSQLQQVAWEAIKGKSGAVVVMDPRDGSLLALVSSPSFDPNLFSAGISPDNWKKLSRDPSHPMENRAVSGQYPPGSTYKLIVAAAALQEGLITPKTAFTCHGALKVGNRTYRCWNKNGHGRVDLHRALVESCDVYFYNLGKILGVDKIAYYAQQFGLGRPTGIDLPREKPGFIPTSLWKEKRFKEPWQTGETISISIGQGFNLLTPVQLVNAYAALANGGVLYRPRLVQRIESMDGRIIKTFEPEEIGRLPLSEENREILRHALWGVVNQPGGTGHAARKNTIDVCGKTGTAQVIGLPEDENMRRRIKISGKYRDHALFVCFAPCNKPEIAIAVVVEHSGHGGSVAAPIARRILDAYFDAVKNGDREKPVRVTHRKPVTYAGSGDRRIYED